MRLAGWAGLIVLFAAAVSRGEVTAADVLAKLRPEHPRLMMTAESAADIKASLAKDAWLKSRYKKLRKDADVMLDEPPCTYDKTGGDGIHQTSYKVMGEISTLAVVYRISGEKKYLDRCWKELDAAAKFPDWDPKHFLDTAEMTAAIAMGYDWLYDQWSSYQKK